MTSLSQLNAPNNDNTFRATKLWNEILHSFFIGISLKKHRKNMKTHYQCFVASEAVDWLLDYLQMCGHFTGRQISRHQAISLLRKYVKAGLIERVDSKKIDHEFNDGKKLYRFTKHANENVPLISRSDLNARQYFTPSNSKSSREVSPISCHQPIPSVNGISDERPTNHCHFLSQNQVPRPPNHINRYALRSSTNIQDKPKLATIPQTTFFNYAPPQPMASTSVPTTLPRQTHSVANRGIPFETTLDVNAFIRAIQMCVIANPKLPLRLVFKWYNTQNRLYGTTLDSKTKATLQWLMISVERHDYNRARLYARRLVCDTDQLVRDVGSALTEIFRFFV